MVRDTLKAITPALRIVHLSSVCCTAVGMVVLFGWATHFPALTRLLPGAEPMAPNAAINFLALGIGFRGALRGGWLARARRGLVLVALTVASVTLVEYVSGAPLGLDTLLVADPTAPRMPPMAAVDFIAASAGALAIGARAAWPTQLSAAIVSATSLVALAAYLYGAPDARSLGAYATLPIHTTLLLLTLAVGLVCLRPRDGFAGLLAKRTVGGRLARRLLPAAILFPLLVGWLRLVGQRSGLYDIGFGLAMFSVVNGIIFVVLTVVTARWIDRADNRQRQIEFELAQASRLSRERAAYLAAIVDYSEDAIVGVGWDGTIRSWNRGAERLYGYEAGEVQGRPLSVLAPPGQVDELSGIVERAAQGETIQNLETVRVGKDQQHIDVSFTVSPILDADNRMIGTSAISHDISSRKRVEAALRAASTFSQQIVRGVGEGIAVYDLNLRYVLFNPAMERLAGRAARDVVGAHPAELAGDWESGSLRGVLERALGGERIVREAIPWDSRFKPSVRWVDDEHTPLRSESNHIIGVIAVVRDVTERKRRAVEIERLNRLYAALTHVNQTIVRAQTRRELLDGVCRALVAHGGFLASWVGRHDPERNELVPEAWWGFEDEFFAALRGATDSSQQGPGPAAIAFRTGRPCICSDYLNDPVTLDVRDNARKQGIVAAASFPIRLRNDVCGALTVYAGEMGVFREKETALLQEVADDVCFGLDNLRSQEERRAAVRELRANDERMRFALDSARMGVAQVDLDSGRVTATESMSAVLGRPIASLGVGPGWADAWVHPDDRPRVQHARTRGAGDPTGFSEEFRVVRPDGTLRWVYAAGFLAERSELAPARMIQVFMDITERRLLEAQLRQAQKMEAVGQLAGGVAHDFNNLLTAILGYSRFLSESVTDPAQLRDVAEIARAGEQAAGLTRQLLAFSRRQTLEATPLDLNVIVRDIVPMLRRLIGEHVELTTNLAADLDMVIADRGQIEQVIMNLAVNSRDAMPGGGRIRIETSEAELGREYLIRRAPVTPGTYVMLAVSDTGQGMSEEVQARIFEPFFTTKGLGKGTGLGLATVYGIVKQSGGYIWAYSELERGTTFKVYLPRASRTEAEGAAPRPKAAVAGGSETVLVVEDEDSVRFLVQMILERAGYRVLQAGSPDDAAAVFAEHSDEIAALVTDVILPGGTGVDLHQRLSARRASLRVLFMSGYSGDAAMDHAHLSRDAEFLQKPFAAEALLGRLREVLDR